MSGAGSRELRERVSRWIEDGQGQMSALLAILNNYDRLEGVAESAQRERDRLREFLYENERLRNQVDATETECERLREEVARLRAETERYRREREEVADSLAKLLHEVVPRLSFQQA